MWALAFAGGLAIGVAAILLYVTLGRIAGVSGIFFGAVSGTGTERLWQLFFLGGVIIGGWFALMAGFEPLGYPAAIPNPLLLATGGLAVGFGTRLAHGCTSGHGVCGLGRLSPRSLIAVITFILLGIVTATWLRPWLAVWFDA